MGGGSHPTLPGRYDDTPIPEVAGELLSIDALLAKTHNSSSAVGVSAAKYLISFGLYTLRQTIAEILDNRGDFSDLHFK